DVSQCEIPLPIQKVEKRQRQSRRDQQQRRGRKAYPARATCEKLQPVQHPPREQPKVSARGAYLDLLEPGLLQKIRDSVPPIPQVVLRRLMHFPLVRDYQQKAPARSESSRQ